MGAPQAVEPHCPLFPRKVDRFLYDALRRHVRKSGAGTEADDPKLYPPALDGPITKADADSVVKENVTWPVAILANLVSACSSRCDLAILSLCDAAWLGEIASATLEKLMVGPHHDVIDLHSDMRL